MRCGSVDRMLLGSIPRASSPVLEAYEITRVPPTSSTGGRQGSKVGDKIRICDSVSADSGGKNAETDALVDKIIKSEFSSSFLARRFTTSNCLPCVVTVQTGVSVHILDYRERLTDHC